MMRCVRLLGLTFLVACGGGGGGVATRTTAPPLLAPAPSVFPPPAEPWLDAPALEGLLANVDDDRFTWSTYERVQQLRTGDSLTITFNRAVAGELEVGRPAMRMPLELRPEIPGVATFIAPHVLSFTPDVSAFSRTAEVRFRPSPALRSRAGETLGETEAMLLVLDGTPRLVGHEPEVSRGRPLRFYFDAPVSANALRSEVLLYEAGGGMRTIAFRARSLARRADHGDYPIELLPTQALAAGTDVGFAVTPRWTGSGTRPGVRFVRVEPRPHLVLDRGMVESDARGYGHETAASSRDALGVIRISDALRLASTHALAPPAASALVFVPEVRGVSMRLDHEGRELVVSGDFEAGRTYTLRVNGLQTTTGEPLEPTPMLTVRRDPPPASASWLRMGHTCERDTPCALDFRVQNAPAGAIAWLEVPREGLAQALVGALPTNPRALRTTRANEHTRGETSLYREARGHVTALPPGAFGATVVRIEPVPGQRARHDAFVQRTDLATTMIALDAELVTWVTSLSDAAPIEGASVHAAQGPATADARTNALGIATLPRAPAGDARTITTVVSRGDDASAMSLVASAPRPGAAPATRRVAMLTDRGIYRPGERVRVVAFVRDVTGATGRVGTIGAARMRLVSLVTGETLSDAGATEAAGGRYVATLDVPLFATRSECAVELVQVSSAQTIADTRVRVATFDTPRSVVDLSTDTPSAVGDTPFTLVIAGRQLVGTPLAGASTRVVLRRVGEAGHDDAFARFVFGPEDAHVFARTEHEAGVALDAEGRARVTLPFAPEIGTRTRYRADVVVQDAIGEETAASIGFVGVPSAVDVGVALEQDFVTLGERVGVEVVALGPDETKLDGARVEVRLVERSGHTYYEQVRTPRGVELAARTTTADRTAETCEVTTADGLARCRFTPARAGTYRLEARARDARGRTSTTTRTLYVAGPVDGDDASAGRALTVRSSRRSVTGGEAFDVTFVSPFEDAEMLLAVTTSRLVHAERKRIGAGPQSVRVVATDAMVPGARVTVVLAKPRSAPYALPLDLGAPSVRTGSVEIAARPAGSLLDVAFERVPARVRTAERPSIGVRVKDATGRGVRGHVVVYAVDEAVLRLTGYAPPLPAGAFFAPEHHGYALDDVRGHLVRPSLEALLATGAGDGGEDEGSIGDAPIPSRERFDPTLVFLADVTTDAEGRATVALPAAGRATELRLMAVAVDDGLRSGVGVGTHRVVSPIAIRPLFPLVLTTGDATHVEGLVTNTGDTPVTATATFDVGGAVSTQTITLGVRESKLVRQPFTAGDPGEVRVKLVVRGADETLEHEAPVLVRGEEVGLRRAIAGAFHGDHAIVSTLPEDVARGSLLLTIRRGRFVGHRGLLARLRDGTRGSAPIALASRLHVLARLVEAEDVAYSAEERAWLALELREALEALRAARSPTSGFDANGDEKDDLAPSAAVYFLLRDVARTLGVPDAERDRMRARIDALARIEASFVGMNADAQAEVLAALAADGMRNDARLDAAYTQRSLLSRVAKARLARAFDADDGRRATLVTEALEGFDLTRTTYVGVVSTELLLALAPLAETHEALEAYVPRIEASIAAVIDQGRTSETPWFAEAVDLVARLDDRERAGAEVVVTLDGAPLAPTRRTARTIEVRLDARRMAGAHRLGLRAAEGAVHTFELAGTYVQPSDPMRSIGRRVFVLRRLETLDGRAVVGPVPRSTAVRVRTFVVSEHGIDDPFRVVIPDFGGASSRSERATLEDELRAILGAPRVDGVTDPRTVFAERTLPYVRTRNVTGGANVFTFDMLPAGLFELTYVVRATAPGRYHAPPATIAAGADGETWARTGVDALEVAE